MIIVMVELTAMETVSVGGDHLARRWWTYWVEDRQAEVRQEGVRGKQVHLSSGLRGLFGGRTHSPHNSGAPCCFTTWYSSGINSDL